MMQLLECKHGTTVIYYGARTEHDVLRDTDLLDLAAIYPEIELVFRELQFRRNEMENQI